MKLLFLDTETTGLDEEARLIQVAYRQYDRKPVNEFFKPLVKIGYEAMAVHHITEGMVENKPKFKNSSTYMELEYLLEDNILVAHNAPFDIGMLEREGLKTKWYICTKRVAQHLLQDEKRHNMQYLRYSLGLDVDLKGLSAHDALADIIVLEALFTDLLDTIMGDMDLANTMEQDFAIAIKKMVILSKTPVLLKTFVFGRHKDKTFEDVKKEDLGYLEWLYKSESSKPKNEQNEDLMYTLKYHLNVT